jgi:hypothetical protein
LRITGESIGVDSIDADEKKGDDLLFVRIRNILRLDIGIIPPEARKLPASAGIQSLTCFTLVTKEPVGKFQTFEFSTATGADRESVLSALAILLNSEKEQRPTLMLHPRASRLEGQLAPRKSPRYEQFVKDHDIAIQSPPEEPASKNIPPTTVNDEGFSQRTLIYASTPPRQGRASTVAQTPRDQGTELALIEFSDSDDHIWGIEDPNQDDIVAPLLETDISDEKDPEGSGWFGPGEGEVVATDVMAGMPTALWCTDDICSGALKDISLTFQGIFIYTPCEDNCGDDSADKRQEVESYIAYVLGAPSQGKQTTSEQISTLIHNGDPRMDVAVPNPKFRNRVCLPNGPSKRWHQLNSEMTFSSALERSKQHMQVVQTTKSMDDIEGLSYMKSTQPAQFAFFDATGYLSSLVDHLLPEVEELDDENTLYYDSDPEDARPRNFGSDRSRPIVEAMLHEPVEPPTLCRNAIEFRTRAVGRRIEEEVVLDVVDVSVSSFSFICCLCARPHLTPLHKLQVMKATTLTLLWHPNPGSSNGTKPVCVDAWIERGTYLISMAYIQPKFMWKPSFESRLEKERKVNVAVTRPEHMDLLEIARVQEEVVVDRKKHPLAQSKTCFTIETRKCTYLFQAQTVKEKKQIVYGLKLTVARLASLLMVRDMRAVHEFFEPVAGGGGVPGQAPDWVR